MARKTGTSMGIDYTNPRFRRRHAAKLRAEERAWAARSGPVRVYFERSRLDTAVQGQYDADGRRG